MREGGAGRHGQRGETSGSPGLPEHRRWERVEKIGLPCGRPEAATGGGRAVAPPIFVHAAETRATILPGCIRRDEAMDGRVAIERNRVALRRILASLVAMTGLAIADRRPGSGGREMEPPVPTADGRPPNPVTLPRRLHRAVLGLLRPAESAARRLIVAAARGLVVVLPPRKPAPASMPKVPPIEPVLRSLGIAVVARPADLARAAAESRAAAARAMAGPRGLCLPLFDPPRRPFRRRRRCAPPHAAPRILFPGLAEPFRLPPPPSPRDPIDATRLGLRLAALGRALDDLPGQARRFARWRCRAEARARNEAARAALDPAILPRRVRLSPLRGGRPPGGRLTRYEPSAARARGIREVDEILAHAHALALEALEPPDTS